MPPNRRRPRRALALVWLLAAACAASTSTTTDDGNPVHHSSAPGGSRTGSTSKGGTGSTGSGTTAAGGSSSSGSSSSGSGSGGGSSSSGSGSSSGGSSSGSPDAGPCNGFLMTATLQDSDALLTGSTDPIAGAQVAALSVAGVPIAGEAAVSNAAGQFSLCAAAGQEFATQVQATGYATTFLEDLLLTQSTTVPAIPLTQSSTVAAYAIVLQGFNAQDALIVAEITSASGQPPCNDMAGWVFSATLPDGGAITYSTGYVGADGLPHSSQPATDSLTQDGHTFGLGFLYNLDTTATDAVLIAATLLDGGTTGCTANARGPFTNRVAIEQSAFSFAPLILP